MAATITIHLHLIFAFPSAYRLDKKDLYHVEPDRFMPAYRQNKKPRFPLEGRGLYDRLMASLKKIRG